MSTVSEIISRFGHRKIKCGFARTKTSYIVKILTRDHVYIDPKNIGYREYRYPYRQKKYQQYRYRQYRQKPISAEPYQLCLLDFQLFTLNIDIISTKM